MIAIKKGINALLTDILKKTQINVTISQGNSPGTEKKENQKNVFSNSRGSPAQKSQKRDRQI